MLATFLFLSCIIYGVLKTIFILVFLLLFVYWMAIIIEVELVSTIGIFLDKFKSFYIKVQLLIKLFNLYAFIFSCILEFYDMFSIYFSIALHFIKRLKMIEKVFQLYRKFIRFKRFPWVYFYFYYRLQKILLQPLIIFLIIVLYKDLYCIWMDVYSLVKLLMILNLRTIQHIFFNKKCFLIIIIIGV